MTNYTLPIAIVHILLFLSLVNTSLIDNAAHVISAQPQSAETSILARAPQPIHHETGTFKRDDSDYDYTNFTALQGTWSGNERFFGGLVNGTTLTCNTTLNTCSIDWYVNGSSLIWVENCGGEIEIMESVLLEFWYGVSVKFWYAGAVFCFAWKETATGALVYIDFIDPLGSCSSYSTAPMCSETHFVVLFTLTKVSSNPTPPSNVTIPHGYPASLAPVQGFWTGTMEPYTRADRGRGCFKQEVTQISISISGDDIVWLIHNNYYDTTFVVWGWIIDFQGSQLTWHTEGEFQNRPICFAWEQNGNKVQAARLFANYNNFSCPSSANPICSESDFAIMTLECVTNCAPPSNPTPPPSTNALQLAQGVWSGTVVGFPIDRYRDCGAKMSCEATLNVSGQSVNFFQYCPWVPLNLYTLTGNLIKIEGNVMWWTVSSRGGLLVPICTVWKQDGRNLVAATDFDSHMLCPSQAVPLCDDDSYVLVYTLECKSGCAPEPVHGPKGLSSGAKVGIVIAVIAFVVIFAVIGVLAFTAYRKRESASPSDYLAMPDDDDKM